MAPSEMPRRGRFAALIVALLVLGTAAAEATRLAVAGNVRQDAVAREATQRSGYAWLAGDSLAEVRGALALDERDPTLHELVAFGDANARLDPPGVTAHLMKSIALRPVSPYAWAALESDRYQRGAPVADLEVPLMKAAFLGPSEPNIQRTVADFGLAIWDEASPACREAVERLVQAGMRRDPNEFMQIAARRGRLHVACRHFDGSSRQADSKWTITCNRLEATS